mmetsp:Transcript_13248/g.53117  ORF Transcript_13248/g.53117 Transcript_13248/m.53117 type:complete len:242 (+) Transcript_13248:862-1587(+)
MVTGTFMRALPHFTRSSDRERRLRFASCWSRVGRQRRRPAPRPLCRRRQSRRTPPPSAPLLLPPRPKRRRNWGGIQRTACRTPRSISRRPRLQVSLVYTISSLGRLRQDHPRSHRASVWWPPLEKRHRDPQRADRPHGKEEASGEGRFGARRRRRGPQHPLVSRSCRLLGGCCRGPRSPSRAPSSSGGGRRRRRRRRRGVRRRGRRRVVVGRREPHRRRVRAWDPRRQARRRPRTTTTPPR